MARAFVIRPFGKKKDSNGREIDFEEVHRTLIEPALTEAELYGSTTGEIIDAGNIREDMFSLILEADLVVADISLLNANVFYELGIRHALRRKHTVLIRERDSADSPPFDILTDRYLKYAVGTDESRRQLTDMVKATLTTYRETDSPVFKVLPSLPEADFSSAAVLPRDFQEEVQRARASKAQGWLRLLADDVRGRRFEWAAMAQIGKAQWDVKDYQGARETWERVRAVHPADPAANLALANVYERLSRDSGLRVDQIADFLTLSDQAIDRVLTNTDALPGQRVEALALQGRNEKTRWRAAFAEASTREERRASAMNQSLRQSIDAYRAAFREDLNHFWSGLATLQMATVFIELTKDGDGWKDTFDDNAQAEECRRNIEQSVAALRAIVPFSVESALKRLPPRDEGRPWAEVSKADTLFLTAEKSRVVAAYEVVKRQTPFVMDAARGQLELFEQLGIRADIAEAVIRIIDGPAAPPPPTGAPAARKPMLALVFAGHRVDPPDRTQARFPAGCTALAKAAIVEEVRRFGSEYEVLGLASAASGGDILFHEACVELGLRSVLCLPFRADSYAAEEFASLNDWRSRFLFLRARRDVWELADGEVLPRWLQGTTINAWERGNRWVLEIARASASNVALLALWDGIRIGGARGGTSHMVQLAEDAGTVDIRIVDSAQFKQPRA